MLDDERLEQIRTATLQAPIGGLSIQAAIDLLAHIDQQQEEINRLKRECDAMEDLIAGQEMYQAIVKDERAKSDIHRRYIGFLQSCLRSGEEWDGDIDGFLMLEERMKELNQDR